jgi:hypothetical protein
MEIFINTNELKDLKLTPTLYCYLYSLYYKEVFEFGSETTVEWWNRALEKLGYLKITEEGIVLRSTTATLFKVGTPTKESVGDWVEDWRDIFPKGVKSGNRPIRGDKQGVKKKMIQFVRSNPDVTKDAIFDATRQYVYEARLNSYKYISCADYFINKNGSSILGAMVEDIEGKGSTLKQMEEGGSDWHQEI